MEQHADSPESSRPDGAEPATSRAEGGASASEHKEEERRTPFSDRSLSPDKDHPFSIPITRHLHIRFLAIICYLAAVYATVHAI